MAVTKEENNCNGFNIRLREVISDSKITMDAFAKSIDISLSGLKKWFSEENSPNLKYLIKITDLYKVNLEWLASGRGPKSGGLNIYPEGLHLKIYDVELSAGKGCFLANEFLHSTIIIPNEMINLYNLNNDCVGAFIDGDSMEPKLHNGDTVIIDTSITTLEDDGIYAFYYDDHCYIKQLQKLGTEIKVKSLNPDYDSWIVKDNTSFKVVGKYKGRFSGNKL